MVDRTQSIATAHDAAQDKLADLYLAAQATQRDAVKLDEDLRRVKAEVGARGARLLTQTAQVLALLAYGNDDVKRVADALKLHDMIDGLVTLGDHLVELSK